MEPKQVKNKSLGHIEPNQAKHVNVSVNSS
jgi:hypothetical protein